MFNNTHCLRNYVIAFSLSDNENAVMNINYHAALIDLRLKKKSLKVTSL